jgi:hypothetical protein
VTEPTSQAPDLPITHRHPAGRRVSPLTWIVVAAIIVTAGLRPWYFSLLFVVVLAAVSASRWLEHLTVDERGITVRTFRTVRIPWSQVRSIERSAGGGGIDIRTPSAVVHSPFPYTGKSGPATDEQLAAIEQARPPADSDPSE